MSIPHPEPFSFHFSIRTIAGEVGMCYTGGENLPQLFISEDLHAYHAHQYT